MSLFQPSEEKEGVLVGWELGPELGQAMLQDNICLFECNLLTSPFLGGGYQEYMEGMYI